MTNWDKENILNIDVSGKSYLEAIRVAQDNIDFFIKVFQAEDTSDFKFFIKARFEEDEYIEHLWLKPISINDNKIAAKVDNEPFNLTTIKYEDIIVVNTNDVEDWIIKTDKGEILGNFIFSSSK
ncbi:DUF2314 domain-containing protein [Ferruginibacter profundus]